jgi:hypothetical protein
MAGEYNPTPVGNPSLLKRRSWLETQLVKFIGRHTPKCREVVRILSRSLDGPLPLRTRIQLRFHYLICCWCQRYEAQLHLLRKYCRRFPQQISNVETFTLSSEARERIKRAIKDETA